MTFIHLKHTFAKKNGMIDLKGIKNIIFDFGNVICDIDFQLTIDAFARLGGPKLNISVENYINHPVFGDLEKGIISNDKFRTKIRELLQVDASDQAIDDAWSQLIINTDKERIDLLKRLKVHYHLFLLSNTNAIHIATAYNRINEDFDVDLESLFEKIYLSHLLGMAKPNKKIYEYVINDAQIKASETLFIDDNKDNIIAARSLGYKTYHLNPNKEKVSELFC